MARVPPLWWYWIPLVWILSSPWVGFTREPQWKRVHLIPFSDPADTVTDVIGNVLLFVPFGFSAARRPGVLRSMVFAATAAACVSIVAEATQLFSTRRFPSATDVLMGVTGAALGAGCRKLSGLR